MAVPLGTKAKMRAVYSEQVKTSLVSPTIEPLMKVGGGYYAILWRISIEELDLICKNYDN